MAFCRILDVRKFHFVKSGTFAVKVGQEVGLKVGQKSRILTVVFKLVL